MKIRIKECASICAITIIFAALLICIQSVFLESTSSASQLFMYFREGNVDFNETGFQSQIIISVFHLWVLVPIISFFVTRDKDKSVIYEGVRKGTTIKWYISKANIGNIYALISSLVYNGIFMLLSCLKTKNDVSKCLKFFVMAVLLEFFVMMVFVLLSNLMTLLFGSQAGLILTVFVIVALTVLIYPFPHALRELDIMTHYFIMWTNMDIAANGNETAIYLKEGLIFIGAIAIEYIMSLMILKKTDLLMRSSK